MALHPPISADLWRRLARLDARCDIKMLRTDVATGGRLHTSGRNYDRMWRVEIKDRATPDGRTVTCEFAWLGPALEGAVKMAEDAGWAEPAAATAR